MRSLLLPFVLLLVAFPARLSAGDCLGLRPPVDGPVLVPFGPTGRYSGHFGTDLGADEGTLVLAAGPGAVSFSGEVAGTVAVTIDHGGGLKSTVSSVDGRLVVRGQTVRSGTPIARSGVHDGRQAVHVSVRVDGHYVDPMSVLRCLPRAPADGLRLVPVP